MHRLTLFVLVCACACVTSCSTNTESFDATIEDGGAADSVQQGDLLLPDAVGQPDGAAGERFISIYIKGDTTPTTFTDGLSGQTPRDYQMGLGRFELMTSASDPAPVVAFDHGNKPVLVQMLGTTLGGKAPLAQIPAGTYTHGRVLLTMSTFIVDATAHAGLAVPGEIQVTAALSDTLIDNKPWKQNQATFTGSFKPFPPTTIPGQLPALPSTGGGQVVQQDGKTWLVFLFPKPLTVSPSSDRDHKATITYRVFESFRWKDDMTKPGFSPGIFDIDVPGLSFEPVISFGATGYSIETD